MLLYYIGYLTIQDSKYIKINNITALYLAFNELNEYFEEINGNKYLTLLILMKAKKKLKIMRFISEIQIRHLSKIRDLFGSITEISDDYHEKNIEIKFNLDDDFLLNKMIKIYSITIVVGAIFMKIKNINHKFS